MDNYKTVLVPPMEIANMVGWTYLAVLAFCVTLPLFMRPKQAVKVGTALALVSSVPVGVMFFELLPQLHIDGTQFDPYVSFFDLTWSWAASYPVIGYGTVVFTTWPIALGIATLGMGRAYSFRLNRQEEASFQARLDAAIAESATR